MANVKFNIYFDFQGPSGTVATRIPNKTNPVKVEKLSHVLDGVSSYLDQLNFGLEIVGIHVEKTE